MLNVFPFLVLLLSACAVSFATDQEHAQESPSLPAIAGKLTFRQASRSSILQRMEGRRIAAARGALQPRASAVVYPACSSSNGAAYLPRSGFASFPGYAIPDSSSTAITGYLAPVSSEIACVMLCENTPGCTAVTWYNGDTCLLRSATVTGSDMRSSTAGGRYTAVHGSCASLAPQINNATIMASCCNNVGPSTVVRCNYAGSVYPSNVGAYCFKTVNGYPGSSNLVSTLTVAGSGQSSSTYTQLLANCAKACTSFTASGLGNSGTRKGEFCFLFVVRRANRAGCTSAAVDTDAYLTGAANCRLYGGQINLMSRTADQTSVVIVAGTCEQADANGFPATLGGCYSMTSGGT